MKTITNGTESSKNIRPIIYLISIFINPNNIYQNINWSKLLIFKYFVVYIIMSAVQYIK